jgi:hypothetical protein
MQSRRSQNIKSSNLSKATKNSSRILSPLKKLSKAGNNVKVVRIKNYKKKSVKKLVKSIALKRERQSDLQRSFHSQSQISVRKRMRAVNSKLKFRKNQS